MGMFSKGFSGIDEEVKNSPNASGGGSGYGGNDIRRVWMPPGAERTFLFLDDPAKTWEHNWGRGRDQSYSTCLFRQRIVRAKEGCPDCVDENHKKCYFGGFFTVILMTPYTSQKGITYCFGREIFVAKWGSKEKPASLQRLRNYAAKVNGGHTAGLVIDCKRLGDMSDVCGDQFAVIEKLAPDVIRNADVLTPKLIEEHLIPEVRKYLDPKIKEYLQAVNRNISDPEKKRTLDVHYRWNPLSPIDFEEYLDPKNNPRGASVGSGGGKRDSSSDDDSGSDGGGSDFQSEFTDDEIPF